MKVIVCGSRDWTDGEPIRRALTHLANRHIQVEVVHGGARGADSLAGQIAANLGLTVRAELADWVGRGRGAGPERNRRMLALGPSLVLAFKDGLDPALSRGGTEHMLRIAIAAGVPCFAWSHGGSWRALNQ